MRRDNLVKERKDKKGKNTAKKRKIEIITILILIILIIVSVVIKSIKNNDSNKETTVEDEGELTLIDTNLEEYVKETSSGIKINTSMALNENRKVDGLDITNIQLTSQNGISTLLADVTNNTSEATSLKNVYVIFYDEIGNELIRVNGVILPLEVGASTKLNVSLSSNYVSAYDFAVEIR